MEKYKPGYLGKVLPADNPSKMTDFVENQYDAFSKVYDVCKDQSANIVDIKPIETPPGDSSLSVQVSANAETMEAIKEASKDDEAVTVQGGVVSAKV